jgi:hydrogenase expression/formation protein HypC
MDKLPLRRLDSLRSISAATPQEDLMCLGIPGRVTEVHDEHGILMGTVDFGGVRRNVCLAYVADDIKPGDFAVIHVGFAISKVSEEEAKRTYAVLEEMSQLDELEWLAEVARANAEDLNAARPEVVQ